MKYFVIFLILTISILVSIQGSAYALLLSADPVGEMDVVVVGTIISTTPKVDVKNGIMETKYAVDIEEIIKGWNLLENGNNTKSISFYSPGVLDYDSNPRSYKIFDVGDRALLMLNQKNGTLHESLWSRITKSDCSGNEIIQLFDAPGGLSIFQNEKDDSSYYTNQPFSVQYSFFNKNLIATTLNVTINVIDVFPQIYHSESFVLNLDECQAYATAKTEFVIDKPSSISIHAIIDGESSDGISGLDVIDFMASPLKQFKSGITIDEIKCRDNLQLILKTSNNSPTCVKEKTIPKLIERGWGEPVPIPEPELQPNTTSETNFDSEKYYEEFGFGSPLIYKDTSKPVLNNDNCNRYAYWLTEHQKEKIDLYEDYPRYPPWGNQIFPLVDYCITNGDLVKTIVDDKIQWEFQVEHEN